MHNLPYTYQLDEPSEPHPTRIELTAARRPLLTPPKPQDQEKDGSSDD
jgi:hypothetical protein